MYVKADFIDGNFKKQLYETHLMSLEGRLRKVTHILFKRTL